MEFGKLPVDVLSKTVSYQVGEPEYMKRKNSQALKDIQKKYKPTVYGLKTRIKYHSDTITEQIFFSKNRTKSQKYGICIRPHLEAKRIY